MGYSTRMEEVTCLISNKGFHVAIALVLSGCVSQVASLRDYKKNWIGHPINELEEAVARPSAIDEYKKTIGWKETTYKLDNGNSVFVELAATDCFIHWEVDPQGIIIDARTEGNGCNWR